MKWVPFTIHFKIIPANPDKRFEHWRDMQKLANAIYDACLTISDTTINWASPGGGQHSSRGGTDNAGFGGLTYGAAVKPQIGQSPAQAMLSGFYNVNANNAQPHPVSEKIAGGEVREGNINTPWSSNPTSSINTEVSNLLTTINNALNTESVAASVFRLDYSGVVYGDRGYHFP